MAIGRQAEGSAASERRVVTVLFADLVGFTTLGEGLDAEDVATVQDAYFGLVRETLGRYGGRLEKFIGDAAMAVFGVPRALDGDAERAVRGGLALIAGVGAIGGRLGLKDQLSVRVGVTTGEVVHLVDGPDAGRVSGDPVNTAARLQAAARAGAILIDRTTALAVADALELTELEPVSLKGKQEPVSVWEVVAERPERSREIAMGSLRAPTIGREVELERLAAGLAAVRADGGRRAITVVAPPGVGKTRLVDEFARVVELDGTAIVWRARLRPELTGPYDAVHSLLRQAVGQGDTGAEAHPVGEIAMKARLGDRLAAAGLPASRAAVVADAVYAMLHGAGVGSETDRATLFAGWLEALDALGRGAAQVWLVEDVHWAGPDLVAFLGDALSRPGAPRLLVATARPSFLDAPPVWASPEHGPGSDLLDLGTLERSDAGRLIASLVGDCLPPALVDQIVDRSDGNCLFIEELLRTWVGVGTLVRDGEGWRLTTPAEDVALPASVHAIYASQLDDLPPAARTAARRGSVAGRRFPRAALESLGVPDVDGALDSLVRRALVSGPLPDDDTGPGFAYRHALLRDAGYASLARSERADLHVRLARWLEGAAGERLDVVAGTIGDHYATALDVAPALATEVAPGLGRDSCRQLAASWLERAGGAAQRTAANAAAAAAFRRAAELTASDDHIDRARRMIELGRSLATIGGVEEARDAFEAGLDAARRARGSEGSDGRFGEWRRVFSQGAEALAALRYEQLRFVEAWHLSESALAEIGGQADGNSDPTDLDVMRLRVVAARARAGETNDALPWVADAERALAAAEAAGDAEFEYVARRDLASARSEAGLATGADWAAVRELATARGDFATVVSGSIMESAYRMCEAPPRRSRSSSLLARWPSLAASPSGSGGSITRSASRTSAPANGRWASRSGSVRSISPSSMATPESRYGPWPACCRWRRFEARRTSSNGAAAGSRFTPASSRTRPMAACSMPRRTSGSQAGTHRRLPTSSTSRRPSPRSSTRAGSNSPSRSTRSWTPGTPRGAATGSSGRSNGRRRRRPPRTELTSRSGRCCFMPFGQESSGSYFRSPKAGPPSTARPWSARSRPATGRSGPRPGHTARSTCSPNSDRSPTTNARSAPGSPPGSGSFDRRSDHRFVGSQSQRGGEFLLAYLRNQ
jgi:class 3 adenylate cyclase